jgi:hypothetical protein
MLHFYLIYSIYTPYTPYKTLDKNILSHMELDLNDIIHTTIYIYIYKIPYIIHNSHKTILLQTAKTNSKIYSWLVQSCPVHTIPITPHIIFKYYFTCSFYLRYFMFYYINYWKKTRSHTFKELLIIYLTLLSQSLKMASSKPKNVAKCSLKFVYIIKLH